MDGVTILNTYMGLTTDDVVFLSIYCVVLAVIGIVLLIAGIAEESVGPVVLSSFVFCAILLVCKFYPRTEHIQATMDTGASWQELTDRYDIVRVNGRIITMIEKNEE